MICVNCHLDKDLSAFKRLNPITGDRCRVCVNRHNSKRSTVAQRTIPCGVGSCPEMYASEAGAGSHRRVAHGVQRTTIRRDAVTLTAKETAAIDGMRRRAVRGSGDGYMDSTGLLDMLFVDGRRMVIA